jgi:hypothetical protein
MKLQPQASKSNKNIKIINPREIKHTTSMTPVNLKFGEVGSPHKHSKSNSRNIN